MKDSDPRWRSKGQPKVVPGGAPTPKRGHLVLFGQKAPCCNVVGRDLAQCTLWTSRRQVRPVRCYPGVTPGDSSRDDSSRKLLKDWSRRSGLNRGPADYESAALPLSYAGKVGQNFGPACEES